MSSKYYIAILVFVLFWIHSSGQEPELIIPLGHTDQIFSVKYSNNGKFILSGSADKLVKLWDARTGLELRSLKGHKGAVYCVDISSNDAMAASGSQDGTIIIWDIMLGKAIKTLAGHQSNVEAICFSPDNKYVISGSQDNTIKIWDILTGKEIQTLKKHTDRVRSLAFSSDGKYFCSGSWDNTICLWDFQKKQIVGVFSEHVMLSHVAFSPDNKQIISCSDLGVIKIWDILSKNEVAAIDCAQPVSAAFFTSDCKKIIASCWDGTIKVLNANSQELVSEIHVDGLISSLSLSPDEKYIVAGFAEARLEIFDFRDGKKIQTISGHSQLATSVCYANSAKYLAGGFGYNSGYYSIKLWNLKSYPKLKTFGGHSNSIFTLSFSHDEAKLLSGSWDESVRIWDVDNIIEVWKYEDPCINGVSCYAVREAVFANDESNIITGGLKGIPQNINIATRELTTFTGGVKNDITAICVSPDGKHLVTGSIDNLIKLWNVEKKSFSRMYSREHDDYISSLDFFHHTPNFISVSGCTMKIWDVDRNESIYTIVHNGSPFQSVCLSSDDRLALTSSSDGSIILWDLFEKKEIRTFYRHTNRVNAVRFIENDKKFISCSDDATIRIWNTLSDTCLATFICIDSTDWIAYTADNYYMCSKASAKFLGFRIGLSAFPFDQFDLQYNRPDMVLQKIGVADSSVIMAYKNAYFKRLEKMKFNEGMFSRDFHIPEVVILNRDSLPMATDQPNVILNVKANDSKYILVRINILINDVAIFGTNGVDLLLLNTNSLIKEIPVHLSYGQNKIQVSCLNEKGVESYKETVWISYLPEVPVNSDKYLIAICISEYQDARYNLKYAVEDGRDMAALFTGKNTLIDTLFNQNATRNNILALKQKLMQTKVYDDVILYVSGHGLLDKNYDFYFATYDMDFSDPAKRGVLYDDLEGLLDGIPARKKLLLMDACHSGEVDKDEIVEVKEQKELADGSRGQIKTYGYKGTIIDENPNTKLGLQNSFELMQELFANHTRGSGAVVISAAAGTGFALESPEWNNGVFTYCILNGLKNLAADANGDKMVNVNELKDYVSAEVERLTNGAQKPTSRRESLEFDWRVW